MKSTLKALHKKAWKLFSENVRKKGADWRGFNTCFTCKKKYRWKKLHAGHYKHNKLDFDPINIHPQCVKCNLFESGNRDEYYINLVKVYGQEKVDDLRKRASQHQGYSRFDLLTIIKELTTKEQYDRIRKKYSSNTKNGNTR